jgi:hypothetical protein
LKDSGGSPLKEKWSAETEGFEAGGDRRSTNGENHGPQDPVHHD